MWPGNVQRQVNRLKRPRLAVEEQDEEKRINIDMKHNIELGNALYLQRVNLLEMLDRLALQTLKFLLSTVQTLINVDSCPLFACAGCVGEQQTQEMRSLKPIGSNSKLLVSKLDRGWPATT